MNILDEAKNLVHGARQQTYGHPKVFGDAAAAIITEVLHLRGLLKEDKCIRAQEVSLMLLCVKIAREAYQHKDDNLVDIAGYAEVLNMIIEKEVEEAPQAPLVPKIPQSPLVPKAGAQFVSGKANYPWE
jgi:hypothetical protein